MALWLMVLIVVLAIVISGPFSAVTFILVGALLGIALCLVIVQHAIDQAFADGYRAASGIKDPKS